MVEISVINLSTLLYIKICCLMMILGVQNEAGQQLTEFCQENAVVIANIPFLSFFFLFVVDFVIHWNETAMGLHVFPIPNPLPPPSPPAPSRFSQCARSERLSHASNLGW